jgi:N-glycosylase/DNA lyase
VTPTTPCPRFDLEGTLESGQFFRWRREGDAFTILRGLRLFRARQQGELLEFQGADRWFVREFFSLDHDLPTVERVLRRDRLLWPALDACPGLRLLRQDPWECTAAFILSAASNIPRISRTVEAIAAARGRPVSLGDRSWTAFPRPDAMAGEAELRRLGAGFRAPYLERAARLAAGGLLEEIAELDTDDARETLQVLPGVGVKVADCILLFAYGRLGVFPVDTWIRKVMRKVYFKGRRVPDRAVRAFAQERWGDLAGYAQQYLYHWSRRGGLGRLRAPRPDASAGRALPRPARPLVRAR